MLNFEQKQTRAAVVCVSIFLHLLTNQRVRGTFIVSLRYFTEDSIWLVAKYFKDQNPKIISKIFSLCNTIYGLCAMWVHDVSTCACSCIRECGYGLAMGVCMRMRVYVCANVEAKTYLFGNYKFSSASIKRRCQMKVDQWFKEFYNHTFWGPRDRLSASVFMSCWSPGSGDGNVCLRME